MESGEQKEVKVGEKKKEIKGKNKKKTTRM